LIIERKKAESKSKSEVEPEAAPANDFDLLILRQT
jgi:hypothetical protein